MLQWLVVDLLARESPPTALQRLSDERWVELGQPQQRQTPRWVQPVLGDAALVAVVRAVPPPGYGERLAGLLAAPPPDAGDGVAFAWPVDLLHDLDGQVVGYLARRGRAEFSFTTFADPATRDDIAPAATRLHMLRAGRNAAAACAALHHAGHHGLRGRNLRLDDRSSIVVVGADSLDEAGSSVGRDLRHLAEMLALLVDGPDAREHALVELLAAQRPPTAGAWYHAFREAELAYRRSVPRPLRVVARVDARERPTRQPSATRRAPSAHAPSGNASGRRREVDGPVATLRALVEPARRGVFAAGLGAVAASIAGVAPFAGFVAAATGLVALAALRVGRRKAWLGEHQVAAIAVTRVIPFAVIGVALAAFVLADLLLVFGLVLAVSERVFDHGPGFTVGFLYDLAEVPLLWRSYAAAVGFVAGLSAGGHAYDRLREHGRGPRWLVLPMLLAAAAAAAVALGAPLVWWPFGGLA